METTTSPSSEEETPLAYAVSTNSDAGGPRSSSIRQVHFNFDTPTPTAPQPSVTTTAAAVFAASFDDDGPVDLDRYVSSHVTSPSRGSLLVLGTNETQANSATIATADPPVESTANPSDEATNTAIVGAIVNDAQSTSPPLVPLEEIPQAWTDIIQSASSEIFNIAEPRDFQYVGINHCVTHNDTILVVDHRTADGKSLIPMVSSILRGGVALYMVPLIGLGSVQVEKATVIKHNIEG